MADNETHSTYTTAQSRLMDLLDSGTQDGGFSLRVLDALDAVIVETIKREIGPAVLTPPEFSTLDAQKIIDAFHKRTAAANPTVTPAAP